MAGNKVNSKAKTKDPKLNKGSFTPNCSTDDFEDADFSLLRKPIHTSVTGFAEARKIYDYATEELKTLLTNECDLLYECKVCRNIFRSVVNLLAHKRIYCKDKFNPSAHGRFTINLSLASQLTKIKQLEQAYQGSLITDNDNQTPTDIDDRIPLTKDLTAVIEDITKTRGVSEEKLMEKLQQVRLQTISTSKVAVFQNVNIDDDSSSNMRAQVKELNQILSLDKAVLQPDGKFTTENSAPADKGNSDTESVIQISDDDEEENNASLKCKICNLQFSTQKTLKFHVKYKHLDTRLVYPCPDCCDIFATSWSVYRHLYKVHRKSAAQIRRQRESIQTKAFRMNQPPAFYEKKKNNMKAMNMSKASAMGRLERENQGWMDNMEGDGEVPRCGGCGRTFERRAALAAHTHTCQPRNRALARRHLDPKRIEIQIRKDYNKGPAQSPVNQNQGVDAKTPQGTNQQDEKTAPDTLNANKPLIKNKKAADVEINLVDDNKTTDDQMEVDFVANNSEANDTPHADVTKAQTSDSVAISNTKVQDNVSEPKDITQVPDPSSSLNLRVLNLPPYKRTEQNNLTGLRDKMELDVDMDKMQCKKCSIVFTYLRELYYHMACHYNWKRYACKLCNYKDYSLEKVLGHIRVVHKLKGDKEFYSSTVKALSTSEAIDASATDEVNDEATISPEAKRPRRYSSDSDISTSSNTRVELVSNKRKRKVNKNQINTRKTKVSPSTTPKTGETSEQKSNAISMDKVMQVIFGDTDMASKFKDAGKDENSDVDEVEEKTAKKDKEEVTPPRLSRPVRKRSKPKNEDFEYDLSNLLKMEAQGYRDQQVNVYARNSVVKRKSNNDSSNHDYAMSKDVQGALLHASKKAVEDARAHMKMSEISPHTIVSSMARQFNSRMTSIFSNSKARTSTDNQPNKMELIAEKPNRSTSEVINDSDNSNIRNTTSPLDKEEVPTENSETNVSGSAKEQDIPAEPVKGPIVKSSVKTARPIHLSRQSLEVMKNPLVTQNISEFSKAGMTTKILVIKPINRPKDHVQTINGPLKLQAIKLKEVESKDVKATALLDQVKVVKVASIDSPISHTFNAENASVDEVESNAIDKSKGPDTPLETDQTDTNP